MTPCERRDCMVIQAVFSVVVSSSAGSVAVSSAGSVDNIAASNLLGVLIVFVTIVNQWYDIRIH